MISVEKTISPLVESHFPAFYKEQGPVFLLFAEEFFRWLESNNSQYATYEGALITGNYEYHLRRLMEYRDIDTTVSQFFDYFKDKYLTGIETRSVISQKRLIKAAKDLLSAKGSERSIDLFFRLVFNTKVEIYAPGDDILKPSSGKWVQPYYLELTKTTRAASFVGKKVVGMKSGAEAYIDHIITRNVNGKIIDIAYIEKTNNKVFIKDEVVVDSGSISGAPRVLGSLNRLIVTSPGELFTVGEIVDLVSSTGIEGKARVSAVNDVTGILRFALVDGGYGYSTGANTVVAELMLGITNTYNISGTARFTRDETISQNLYSFSLTDVSGDIINGVQYNNANTGTPSVSISVVAAHASGSNTATVVLNQISGNVFTSNTLYVKNRSFICTNTNVNFTQGQTLVQRNTGAGTNSTLGVVRTSENGTILTVSSITGANGIHVGTYVVQDSTGAKGKVKLVNRESNFNPTNVSRVAISEVVGNFNNTGIVRVYSNSTSTSQLSIFTPSLATRGSIYLLTDTNINSNTRWSTGNTAVLLNTPLSNSVVLLASDVGGKYVSTTNVTATGMYLASNTTALGLINLANTFYYAEGARLRGLSSNTSANITAKYTGSGGAVEVQLIDPNEFILANRDYIRDFANTSITGSYTGAATYVSSVLVYARGSGYSNTDKVVFTGGNTASGYTAGNASIVTSSSGNITSVILTSNVGANIISMPSISIVNATGGVTTGTGAILYAMSPLGLSKQATADGSEDLLSLLSYSTTNLEIGTISTIGIVNPGTNYNINPFVVIREETVSAMKQRDAVVKVSNVSGTGFRVGETVTQNTAYVGVRVTSNNFTGNTRPYFEANEVVYSTDGISNVASGIIFSSTYTASNTTQINIIRNQTGTFSNTIGATILTVASNTGFSPGSAITQGAASGILVTSNTTKLVVKSVTGTFVTSGANVISNTGGNQSVSGASNTSIYKIIGRTSKGTANITQTITNFNIDTFMSGVVRTITGNTVYIYRKKLMDNYVKGGTMVGATSGTTATVSDVGVDTSTAAVGENAVLNVSTVTSTGSLSNLEIVSSGLGFTNGEFVTVTSTGGSVAVAQGTTLFEGKGEPYYSSADGFLDDLNYIHDGTYYQNYSYEIQSVLPFSKYESMLKSVLHIAGKKMFGKVVRAFSANASMTSNSTITQSNV